MKGNQPEKWVTQHLKHILLVLVSSNHELVPHQYQKLKAEALVNAPIGKTER